MTSPEPPSSARPVEYKGEPLDAERGPGLGCFRFQLVLLAVVIVLTPLSVVWGWPTLVSAGLLFLTIFLLLFAGQTVIFLLRLVAADRREGRRVPLASATPTVGELEDQVTTGDGAAAEPPTTGPADEPAATVTTDETAATPDAPDDDQPASPGVRE
ncbi:MAG TPA: hypothetical protein VFY23_12030 [Candidatus Limnocylindrales bacterium]|nr:hypothetical protein [Candidatus Limnocylindrales bacterium]